MIKHSYQDGASNTLEKYALKIRFEKKDHRSGFQKALPWIAGAGIPAATIGGLMLSKPGIQASMKNLFSGKGDLKSQDLATELPPQATETAGRVQQALQERGIDPAALRFAVDAPPGMGKTTLSRAIAGQLGLKHYGLDWLPNNTLYQALGGGHIEDMPRPPRAGEILEHYNLLRAYDPEVFDAVVHIKKDPEEIKRRIINRGRSALNADFMDYGLAGNVGGLAFDTLAGDPIDLGDDTMMKLRPREGWNENKLNDMLQEKNMNPVDLSRHEKLLSLAKGQRTTGSGWTPYVKNPLTSAQTAMALGSVPLGMLAAKAVDHFNR